MHEASCFIKWTGLLDHLVYQYEALPLPHFFSIYILREAFWPSFVMQIISFRVENGWLLISYSGPQTREYIRYVYTLFSAITTVDLTPRYKEL